MSVVAKETVRIAGHRQLIIKGELYDESSPVVRERPDLFERPDEHQRRVTPPQNTAELGVKSMSARDRSRNIEDASAEPSSARSVTMKCSVPGCGFESTSERGMKAHRTKVHG